MQNRNYQLSTEEANLIDFVSAEYHLPFSVEDPTTIYDCEENRSMNVEECLSYIEEAVDGNEFLLPEETLAPLQELINSALHSSEELCPLGGDESDDCCDCVYGAEYHFVNGECLCRAYQPLSVKEFSRLKKGATLYYEFGKERTLKKTIAVSDAFWNSDSDEPGWEIETEDGYLCLGDIFEHEAQNSNP